MSRVHDALRRAAMTNPNAPAEAPAAAAAPPQRPPAAPPSAPMADHEPAAAEASGAAPPSMASRIVSSALSPSPGYPAAAAVADESYDMRTLLDSVQAVPYSPLPDSLLIDPTRPHEAPTEEFRSL